ncbi:MAG: nucleotide pyrophosphohydrolase [Rhodospirillales bacterium]|nr:nucleotide pyrophosphohydrolase [Rhodospirillales bacterium]
MTSSLQDLTQRLNEFRDERDWTQFHTLKNLLISLNLEAAELLELSQWKTDEELEALLDDPTFHKNLTEEAADVMLYLLMISEKAGIDLDKAARDKIAINAAKYPAEKSHGNARKYTEL